VVSAARVVLDQVRAAAPDRVEVTFGVKVTGTMNWVVAKAASEGNFEVTLSWEREPIGRVGNERESEST
jgi:NTP-dependent ternary system trypsin peptidase co-occuring protein